MSAPASNGHGGQVDGGIAFLDALAAQLRCRGWTAYLSTPPGRLPGLFVQDPRQAAQCGDVIAVPSGPAGDVWYWFSWAERIAPVRAPGAAADAIIRTFRRPADDTPAAVSGGRAGVSW
jgi:hypothetical protein